LVEAIERGFDDARVLTGFPRLNRAITRDQTEFPDPELPKPPVQQQPVAAGLDEE
jgi:hypothetical protein